MKQEKNWLAIIGALLVGIGFALALAWIFAGDARAATCTPDSLSTPTPTLSWKQNPDLDLGGYRLYYREIGGTWQTLRDFPCEWYDMSEPPDGTMDVRFCRGPDLDIPLQRYCASCLSFTNYEFSLGAFDLTNQWSSRGNTVAVCFSPICVKPGPCN